MSDIHNAMSALILVDLIFVVMLLTQRILLGYFVLVPVELQLCSHGFKLSLSHRSFCISLLETKPGLV